MKIAAVTDDGTTINPHFGRAGKYAVYTIENGEITSQELREKVGHKQFADEKGHHEHHHHQEGGRGTGAHADHKHNRMIAAITDCQILLACGMGRGAYLSIEQAGIKPIQTDIKEISVAVQAILDGSIEKHQHQNLCGEHGHR